MVSLMTAETCAKLEPEDGEEGFIMAVRWFSSVSLFLSLSLFFSLYFSLSLSSFPSLYFLIFLLKYLPFLSQFT